MKTLHENSPCCQGLIRRFGKCRRQCAVCRRTWRVWKRKRGRDRLRPNTRLILNYLAGKRLSFKAGVNREFIRRRLNASLKQYLRQKSWNHPEINRPFIAIVDAMWHTVEKQACTVYFVLIRPVGSNQAWILPPIIIPGQESATGWQITLEQIPVDLRRHLRALVCDGYPHLVYLAKRQGLLVQRCHYHLIASIKNYVTIGPLSRNQTLGKMILTAVQTALATRDETILAETWDELWVLIKLVKSRELKARLRGFLIYINDFRTYQKYPELNLPTTSNAAESLIQCVRDLMYKARGFRTQTSFLNWIKAYCLFKQTIICNGKYQPIKRA